MPKYVFPVTYDVIANFEVDAANAFDAAKKGKQLFMHMCSAAAADRVGIYGANCEKFVDIPIYDMEYQFYGVDDDVVYDACGLPVFADDGPSESEDEMSYPRWIWGVKSGDDLSGSHVSEYTMNDLDVYYNLESKLYELSIEEIYQFSSADAMIDYFQYLCDAFRSYLSDRGVPDDVLDDMTECSSLDAYYPTAVLKATVDLSAKTLVDLYYKFVLFVRMMSVMYQFLVGKA